MTKLFSKSELKILKYKLMNQEGLSESQAEERLKNLISQTNTAHKSFLQENHATKESKGFNEHFKSLIELKKVQDEDYE